MKDRDANFRKIIVVEYLQFYLSLSLFCHSLNSFTPIIMVQISPSFLSFPSYSTDADVEYRLFACLQVVSLQSNDNDCAGFLERLVSSKSAPSIPSLRNESPIFSTLREIPTNEEITD